MVFRDGGRFVGESPEQVDEAIEAMLSTMFGNGRTGAPILMEPESPDYSPNSIREPQTPTANSVPLAPTTISNP